MNQILDLSSLPLTLGSVAPGAVFSSILQNLGDFLQLKLLGDCKLTVGAQGLRPRKACALVIGKIIFTKSPYVVN